MLKIFLFIKKWLNKLNLTFLFSPFRSNIENIGTKMYLNGFQERMFSIQEQCTWIILSVYTSLEFFLSACIGTSMRVI